MAANFPVITELDAARIRELGSRLPDQGHSLAALGELIDMVTAEAEIVPGARIAPDIVTVNSTVSFREELGGTVHKVTVVLPQDASIRERRISVLSPVGRALLGRQAGSHATITMPDGATRRIRILELHDQPEARGDLTG